MWKEKNKEQVIGYLTTEIVFYIFNRVCFNDPRKFTIGKEIFLSLKYTLTPSIFFAVYAVKDAVTILTCLRICLRRQNYSYTRTTLILTNVKLNQDTNF